MVGPTGPRRQRHAIEHLANLRGGACYFIDLDPRWVKRLIQMGESRMASAYQAHAHLLRRSNPSAGQHRIHVPLRQYLRNPPTRRPRRPPWTGKFNPIPVDEAFLTQL